MYRLVTKAPKQRDVERELDSQSCVHSPLR